MADWLRLNWGSVPRAFKRVSAIYADDSGNLKVRNPDGTSSDLGGAGGSSVVSCVLAREAAMNIRTANTYPILWDTLYDNAWDQNTLGSIPAELGLSFVFDGSSAAIETTEAGTWIFTASVYRPGTAEAWEGSFDLGVARAADLMGHTFAARSIVEQTLTIPSGASFSPQITVDVGSATNPYQAFVLMPITRIA